MSYQAKVSGWGKTCVEWFDETADILLQKFGDKIDKTANIFYCNYFWIILLPCPEGWKMSSNKYIKKYSKIFANSFREFSPPWCGNIIRERLD